MKNLITAGPKGAGALAGPLAVIPVAVEALRVLTAREHRLAAEAACHQACLKAEAAMRAIDALDREKERRHERFQVLLRLFQESRDPAERLKLLDIVQVVTREASCPGC